MRLSMDKTVSELVAAHSVCGYVLDRYQIEYVSGGAETLLAACHARGLDPARVLIACELAIQARQVEAIEPSAHSASQLLRTVVAWHHRYLHETLPLLRELTDRMARQFGARLPSLHAVAAAVEAIVATMQRHLDQEERDVFPICVRGDASQIRARLRAVHGDHDRVLHLLEDLRRHCTDYVAPRWAGLGVRTLYAELAYFDADTRRHLYFEDDILLPRFVSDAERAGEMAARPRA